MFNLQGLPALAIHVVTRAKIYHTNYDKERLSYYITIEMSILSRRRNELPPKVVGKSGGQGLWTAGPPEDKLYYDIG
jgi:hypothetical protein